MRYILATIIMFLSLTSISYAHAHVETSEPTNGQVLTVSPEAIKITFSEALRLDESLISVYDSHKKPIDGLIITKTGDEQVLSYTLPQLTPGTYTVKWKAVCLCTDHHATNGSFTFTVKG